MTDDCSTYQFLVTEIPSMKTPLFGIGTAELFDDLLGQLDCLPNTLQEWDIHPDQPESISELIGFDSNSGTITSSLVLVASR